MSLKTALSFICLSAEFASNLTDVGHKPKVVFILRDDRRCD